MQRTPLPPIFFQPDVVNTVPFQFACSGMTNRSPGRIRAACGRLGSRGDEGTGLAETGAGRTAQAWSGQRLTPRHCRSRAHRRAAIGRGARCRKSVSRAVGGSVGGTCSGRHALGRSPPTTTARSRCAVFPGGRCRNSASRRRPCRSAARSLRRGSARSAPREARRNACAIGPRGADGAAGGALHPPGLLANSPPECLDQDDRRGPTAALSGGHCAGPRHGRRRGRAGAAPCGFSPPARRIRRRWAS